MADNKLYNQQGGYSHDLRWLSQSRNVIACLLTDYGTILEAAKYPIEFIHPSLRQLHEFIINDFIANQSIVTLTAIEANLGPEMAQIAKDIKSKFDPEFNSLFDFTLPHMGEFGAKSNLSQLGQDLTQISGPVEDVIEDIEDRIRQIRLSSSNFRPGDSKTVLGEMREQAARLPQTLIKTYIPWLDNALGGGCYAGFNYWCVGSYKSGKTTLARNIALNMLDNGHYVCFIIAESSRDMLMADLLSMVMNRKLMQNNPSYKPRFNGLLLYKAIGTFNDDKAVFSKAEFEALDYAYDRLEDYNIYLWDTRDGVTNLSRFNALITNVIADTGCKMFFADHSQLFGNPNENMFERQSKTARFVQDCAIQHQISFWMLSQLNESALKGGFGKNSESIGVRGGGDAAAAAEIMLRTKIDEETNTIDVTIAHSRRSGKGTYTNLVEIMSGLFLETSFKKDEAMPNLEIKDSDGGPDIEGLAESFLDGGKPF